MNPALEPYLKQSQYEKIISYWKHFERLEMRIEISTTMFDYIDPDEEEYLDEEELNELDERNKALEGRIEQMRNTLFFLQQEYEMYINRIGYRLNDQSCDEHLFNLINSGIVID